MSEYRRKAYSFWEDSIAESPLVITKDGPSGASYTIEIDVVWDDREAQRIRAVFSIDDGGFLSSLVPMTDDFFVSQEQEQGDITDCRG